MDSNHRTRTTGLIARQISGIILAITRVRFRLLGLATIRDIPTDRFNLLVKALLSEGWKASGEYEGFDAWIDYGKVKLRKGRATLTFEWDNWTEGSVEGPRSLIEELSSKTGLPFSHEWRWSTYHKRN